MLHTIPFSAPTGSTAKAIPADPSIPFSHYTDYGITATESVSQPGTFTVTLDDTEYLRWWIFLGASDPTAAEDNHAIIDLSQGPLVEQYDTASSGDSYNRFAVTGSGVTPNVYAADIGLAVSGTGNSREWQWTVASKDCVLFRSDVPDGTMRWIIEWDAGTTFFLGPTASSPLGTYTKQGTASIVTLAKKQIARKAWRSIGVDQTISSMVETVSGQPRFKQEALAQVVRWVSGPVLPNEPYPPIRRLGTRDLVLFNGEDVPALIPLEHLDSETLSSIEGEELRFTVETSRKVVLLSQLLTVNNGSIQVPSTSAITGTRQNLQWSLRWPDNNAYLTGGRITVAYAPIQG